MMEEIASARKENVIESKKEFRSGNRKLEQLRELRKSLGEKEWLQDETCLNDKEYMECIEQMIGHKLVQSMKNYCQHGTTTTLTHCIHVSYLSYQICKKLGLDYQAAARGGLLHDFFLYDWHTHCKETKERFHGFYHPRKALNNAKREFELTEKEKDIILKHMWPLTVIPPKSWEGMVVMYADKICTIKEMYENAISRKMAPV